MDEPGTLAEIKEFVRGHGLLDPDPPVTHIFSKINVNGEQTHDVFKFCRSFALSAPPKGQAGTAQKGGDAIKWNFGKYVIDGDGRVVMRFKQKETVADIDTPELLGAWAKRAPPAATAATATISSAAT